MRFFLLMRNLRVKQRTIESLCNQHKAKKISDLHKRLSVACQHLYISESRPVCPLPLIFVRANFVLLFGPIICKYFTFLRSICLFLYAQYVLNTIRINYKNFNLLNLETRVKMVIWVVCRGYIHMFKIWPDRIIIILDKREITLAC